MKKHVLLFVLLLLMTALLLAAFDASNPEKPPSAAGTALCFAERADSVSGEYSDASGNHWRYTYSLPVVSGDTEDAAAVNAELDGIFETYIAPELRHMAEGFSLVTTYASWRTAAYKGIPSLLVRLHNAWDDSLYYTAAFTAQGRRVPNAELFAALGITGEEFTAAAAEKLTEHMGLDALADRPEEIRAVAEACRDRTLAPENCNAELPIFVTSYGTVCFVGRVYTPAGAGQYDHLFILTPQDGFTGAELAELAQDSYGMRCGHRPEAAAFASNADGTVTISLYDRAEDPASLCERYVVSPETGAGVDSRGVPIDLTVQ